MARFTEPVKWSDGWFSNLTPIQKLTFLYLTDKCDNAGFFEINKRLDAFTIGISEDEYSQTLVSIKRCYIMSIDGSKLWLKNYLKHQRNFPLNPENNAHRQIINLINLNNELFQYDFTKLGAKEGLISPPVMSGKGNVISNGAVYLNGSTVGGENAVAAAKKAWDDQRWRESICMGNGIKEAELRKWMSMYNASIMNDTIENFNDNKYKKMFGGWLQVQKSKGYSVIDKKEQVETLRKL